MVLVTGGTGLVGSHLLLHLLQEQIAVRATYRTGSDLGRVQKVFSYYTENASELFQKIEWAIADLSDIPALETAFHGVDQVYHTAAIISFNHRDYKKLKKTNTDGTTNIVNLCLDNNIKKLCYVSTIGAIGNGLDGSRATEENEWVEQDTTVYAKTKYAAEMEVWRGSQEGLSVVMVNPGVILGPGFWKSGSGTFFSTVEKGYSYYPPGGTGFVTITDVVHIMKRLMDANIKNERFILVAQNLKYQEILGMIAEKLGKKKPTKQLKHWQLQIGRYFDWMFDLLTHSGRRITKNTIKSLYHRDNYDAQKIKETLDFEFEALEPTLKFCCEKFKEENRQPF